MKIFIESNHPQTILKYNPCTQYSKEAFIEHYLFASHPFRLNDLMDGKSYSIDMRNVSDELYYEIKRQTIEQAPLIVEGKYFNQLYPEIDKNRELLQKAICDSYFCFGGIVSLTTDRFNELMWSHYTNETGYVIEFNTSLLLRDIANHPLNIPVLKNIFFKSICYKEHPTGISCSKHPDIHEINLHNATQKNKVWNYENEWRLIVTSYPFLGIPKLHPNMDEKYTDISKRKLYYTSENIKRIYLGKKFWSAENVVHEKKIDDNSFYYIVKDELIPFIKELCKYENRVYMSGSSDCAEFKFGTDKYTYNEQFNEYTFNPDYYYLKRSFELIKKISIEGKFVYVEYTGKVKTSDEEFES